MRTLTRLILMSILERQQRDQSLREEIKKATRENNDNNNIPRKCMILGIGINHRQRRQ